MEGVSRDTLSYTCHLIADACGIEHGDYRQAKHFYSVLFGSSDYGGELPPAFSRFGAFGEAGPLTKAQLYSTRIIALSLAALMVEDGYCLRNGKLLKGRARK